MSGACYVSTETEAGGSGVKRCSKCFTNPKKPLTLDVVKGIMLAAADLTLTSMSEVIIENANAGGGTIVSLSDFFTLISYYSAPFFSSYTFPLIFTHLSLIFPLCSPSSSLSLTFTFPHTISLSSPILIII